MTSNEEKKRILDELRTYAIDLEVGWPAVPFGVLEKMLPQALDSYRESVVGELREKIEKLKEDLAEENIRNPERIEDYSLGFIEGQNYALEETLITIQEI